MTRKTLILMMFLFFPFYFLLPLVFTEIEYSVEDKCGKDMCHRRLQNQGVKEVHMLARAMLAVVHVARQPHRLTYLCQIHHPPLNT